MLLETVDFYSMKPEDFTRYRQELEADNPNPPSFPRIDDADIFRVLFHCQPELKLDPSKAIDALPADYLENLHVRYCKRLIATTPPLEATLDPDDITVHSHPVAYRLFEVVVRECGKDLNERHGNINWHEMARLLGLPFELRPDFAFHIRHHYYLRIAPFVELWLTVLRLVEAQLELTASFPLNDPSYLVGSPPESVKDLLYSAMSNLSDKVRSPTTVADLALLRPESGTLTLEQFISTIAHAPRIRAVARSLPSHLAHVLMHAIQWVLDYDMRDSSEIRSMVIKLFQDVVNDSHELPESLFIDGLTINASTPKEGGEASVYFGELNSKAVAVRVPNPTPVRLDSEWLTNQKRYKRAIIQQRQLSHNNLVQFLGLWISRDGTVSLVMPEMDHTLSSHSFDAAPGPYVDMAIGIVEGLEHLHQHRIVHGDLHWKNILVDQANCPKIADFGVSRIDHRGGNTRTTDPLVSSYIAFMPHEIRGDQNWSVPPTPSIRPTLSTDVFSCGMMLVALALPELYSVIESQVERLTSLADQFARRDAPRQRPMFGVLPEKIATPLWSLILEMTKFEAGERPPMGEIKGRLMNVSQLVQELGYTSYNLPRDDRATQEDGPPVALMEREQVVDAVGVTSANVSSESRARRATRSKAGNTESSNKVIDLKPQPARPDSSSTKSPRKRRSNAKSEVKPESGGEDPNPTGDNPGPSKRPRRTRRAA